jgi:anti-sigma regulatory factor (Ser/Thr protein kinase)
VWVTAVTTTAAFVVTVRDYGAGFRPGESSNGLGVGLQLIHSLADTVTITNSNPGLAVCMTFWLYDKSEAAVC